MDWLTRLKLIGAIRVAVQRKTLIRISKVNTWELETCKPKGVLRERSFGRTEKVDHYHLLPDGTIKHTPDD